MIEIKAFYSGWKDVTKEEAIHFASTLCKHGAILEAVNKNHIRGYVVTKEDLR